ncbi:MAG: hypothetical protein IKW83_08175 [Muribaculaceae bacterium]|nr:hypothetical protein [Muribaculaceae bacterium]
MNEQEKQQEQNVANEPEVVYGNIDALKTTVIEAVQRIQDANLLERILSFIKKDQTQEDIPNEVTLAAMREAESGEDLEVLDVEHFKEFVASL